MMTESLAYPGDTRRLSVGEEVLNAVSHGVGWSCVPRPMGAWSTWWASRCLGCP